MPIKHDDSMECEVCHMFTIHNRTIYKDIEYRVCTRCHTKTQWKPDGGKLEQTSKTREDTSIPRYDEKRTRDHGRWRKRWRKGRPEEDE